MKKIIQCILVSLICFLIFSCGYKLSGAGKLEGGISKLNVFMFKNLTGETGVEHVITNDIIHELSKNGVKVLNNIADIATGEKKSAPNLTGTINSISLSAISRSNIISSNERRVKIIVNIKLTNNNGETLRAVQNINEDESYRSSDDKQASDKAKLDAIKKLSKRLAEKIYSQLTENF